MDGFEGRNAGRGKELLELCVRWDENSKETGVGGKRSEEEGREELGRGDRVYLISVVAQFLQWARQ